MSTRMLAVVVVGLATTSHRAVSFSTTVTTSHRCAAMAKPRLEMVASMVEIGDASTAQDVVTMDDVVEATRRSLEETQRNPSNEKTHFGWFEDYNNDRIDQVEKIAAFDTLDGSSTQIQSWNRLKTLLTRGIMVSETDQFDDTFYDLPEFRMEASQLYQTMQESGGYLVLELGDNEASIVRDMWTTMEAYFSLPQDQQQVDLQNLEKKDGTHDPNAGYMFSRTYLNRDGVVMPETIQEALGNTYESHNGIGGSCALFADICKTVGTIVAAGALETSLGTMNTVVSSMLDEKSGHPFVNAEHRLAQYRTDSSRTQSLITHTDWTFTTCIPLSAVPGLQVWNPAQQRWIVPEKDGARQSNCVVVIAGNWIELLTQQKLTACVHRVVTDPLQTQPRLSAPFFCRPKEFIFELYKDRFDNDDDDDSRIFRSDNQSEAMNDLCRLFGDLVRFTEGDRDPAIPSCILDACLYQGDGIPNCYSIEDVLGDSALLDDE